jgi:hypothetical protein
MYFSVDSQGRIDAKAEGVEAIEAQVQVINAHIRSQTLLKFGLYGLAAFFVIVASVLVVFAPAGRETVTTIIAIALFAVAVGSAGFGTFAVKAPGVSVQAGRPELSVATKPTGRGRGEKGDPPKHAA